MFLSANERLDFSGGVVVMVLILLAHFGVLVLAL
jgi:hypothetical protein